MVLPYGLDFRVIWLLSCTQNIQRTLDIIGLPRYFLPSLEERRKTMTAREFRRIKDGVNHSCHVLTKLAKHQYNLRSANLCRSVISGTQRHKPSFIPKVTSLINS